MAATWPPDLTALKAHLGVADDRDDTALQQDLDAAIAYVTRAKGDEFGFFEANADTVLGTLLLAARHRSRSKSPDGVITMGELGTSRVPAYDADIERLLEIGRWGGSVIV